MIDQNTAAAKSFYREVRKFAENAKPWDANAIFYETKPDEALDLSLVLRRVYGRRDEFLAVMAAAGLDSIDQHLPQKRIVLPNAGALIAIKRRCSFESVADSSPTARRPRPAHDATRQLRARSPPRFRQCDEVGGGEHQAQSGRNGTSADH